MSAVTLNLRIAPSAMQKMINKSSKQKSAEVLPTLPEDLNHLQDDCLILDILNAKSLEPQIVGIRQVRIGSFKLKSLNIKK